MSGAELRRTFGIPAIIALASVVGLVSALIGDGVFDAISWMALGAVIGVLVLAVVQAKRQ
ncbi:MULTISPECIES: hypothetical protein [unclassified Pseudoxanthomonas]|jgi:hypothetical protein|uniref:hypothetical protein n=1 Tax=unclassified Pseudoxanthomonas TaxID=2645906 RepID=UPI003076D115